MAQKKGNRIFVWIVVGLLFVGLLGFGATGLSGTIRSIGTVGNMDIPVAQYQRALNQQIRAFEAQIGTPVSFPQATAIGLDRQVLGQLVTQRVLDNETANIGLSIGDARVRDEVLSVPAFRGLDGQFDREAYRFALQQSGQTEAQFENGIREEIARTIVQGAIVSGVAEPATYAETLVNYVSERRNITHAVLTGADLIDPVAGATDADLQTYYTDNPDAFTAPEQRDITYVWLTPDMIQDQVTVDADSVRALYDERINEFMRPERRLVERLVFVDEATATAAIGLVNAGESDFDALVAERGLELDDVDLGDVDNASLGAAGDAVFAASAGDVLGPFNSSLGPALFRMNAVLAAEETPFEEAEPELRDELAAARATRIIEDGIDGINDLLAGGATLEDLAQQTDMQLGTIQYSTDNRDAIAAYDEFRAAADTAEVGVFPAIADLSDGGIFALRLNDVAPPALRAFDEVADDVRAAWDAQATQSALMEQARTLSADILPLTGFDTLGLSPVVTENVTRHGFVSGTPPSFLTDVFDMALGDVDVIDGGNTVLIVRLDSISMPGADDPQVSAERSAVAESASAGIAQDMFEAFTTNLQSRTDISLNQSAINAVHAHFQ